MDTITHLGAQLSIILAIAYLVFEARRWARVTGRRLIGGLRKFVRIPSAGAAPWFPLAAVGVASPAFPPPRPTAPAAGAAGETRGPAVESRRGENASSARPNAALILLAAISAVAIAAALLDAGSRRPRPDPGASAAADTVTSPGKLSGRPS